MNCREFSKYVADYVNRTLDEGITRSAEAHLGECSRCASLVAELNRTSQMVQSLERASAPVGFEERLKARLAAERSSTAQRSRFTLREWVRALGKVFAGSHAGRRRLTLRPALVGLLLCAVIVGSLFMVGRDWQAGEPGMDWGYIETCREQHASFAAANPLADESALILRERASDLGEL